MDAKITIYGLCLVFIIAVTSFWSYMMGVDDAQKDLNSAREHLEAVEKNIVDTRAWIVARKEASALITAANHIEQENVIARENLDKINQQRSNIAKAFVAAIERARSETIGVVMPEVRLASGTILKQAKLQSVDPEIAVFQHSEGVSKVPTSILPTKLLDRLRFGFNPAGLGIGPAFVETTVNIPIGMPDTRKISTAASDSLVRLGLSAPSTPNVAKKKPVAPRRDPNRIKIEGDPALWKNVERTSIGRAYIPGQGWLRVGADGPIPGSARK